MTPDSLLRWRRLCACLLLAGAARAQAAVFPLPPPDQDLVGVPTWINAQPGDTLATIAFRQGLGFREVIHANPGVDPWKLRTGQRIALPTQLLLPDAPRVGIVVNVPEMRLYYFPKDDAHVFVYPVAVGRVDWKTPLGDTVVRKKVANPTWHPTDSIRAEHAAQGDPLPLEVPPGEDNPLGAYALRLGWPDILIHGTDKPMGGIGMPVTHGCIRLYPQDIETLYNVVPVGTPVSVIEQAYKLGRGGTHWYVEARAGVSADPQAPMGTAEIEDALATLKARADDEQITPLDWVAIQKILRRGDGLPALAEPRPPMPLRLALHQPQAAAPRWVLRSRPQLLAVGLLVVLALGVAGLVRLRFHRRDVGGGAHG
ncbi:MAG TPA: L,D-transpeptidase family protein [Nevskiaceae bacterium]|nr:L,D-transpeptidase family protein [Nevskiaceae bacterium]